MANNTYQQSRSLTLTDKLRSLIKLSRWREHVPYTVPLVIGGAMLAVHIRGVALDWRLLSVLIANILAMSFAFMINDVEDAPDDALHPRKQQHNVISSGELSVYEGSMASAAVFVMSLTLYGIGGWWTFGIGGATLVLSYLYSAHPFRLKARPVTDVISHALMLSGLLMMSGFFTYHHAPDAGWFVIIGVTLISAYGQFYNQIDDYEVDKAAGLQNTVVLLGEQVTTLLMYMALFGGGLSLFIGAWLDVFPAWLGTVTVITIFTSSLFTWDSDMRGNPVDGFGAIQKPILLIANVVMLLWMAHELGLLFGL
jgi:4-hydroxybenzoate polyprenyltransferase